MRVSVNDHDRELHDGATLGELLDQLGLDARAVVVERNGEVVARDRAAATELSDGDRLIVVRAVAGGSDLRDRLAAARLYVVTDARRGRGDLERFLGAVCTAGVEIVQLREKDASDAELAQYASVFRRVCDDTGTLFVLNDRPDLAVELGADGAHVGQDDLDPAKARELLGGELLLGRSTHGPAQLDAAASEPVDYVAVGPVHETPTKPGRPAVGLGAVRHAAGNAVHPWFAIGGIDLDTMPAVVAAGARRIVVVRAVTEADDPAEAVRRLAAQLQLS